MSARRALAAPLLVAAALAAAGLAAAAAPPLQYEGISAATTLDDLKTRFGERVDLLAGGTADPKRPVSASVRFDKPLGRSDYLDYYEIAGKTRVIRLFFAVPAPHPQNEGELSCKILLDELRGQFGKEPKQEESDEERLHHVKHIWSQGNQTMTLDCAHLPSEPLTVDRLFFECRGTCASSTEAPHD